MQTQRHGVQEGAVNMLVKINEQMICMTGHLNVSGLMILKSSSQSCVYLQSGVQKLTFGLWFIYAPVLLLNV